MNKSAWSKCASWLRKKRGNLKRSNGEPVLLFVHGLSGSPNKTWDKMVSVLRTDADLSSLSYDCYGYPTSKIRLPFGKRMAGINEIASGLQTHIDTNHKNKKIILVGHSLGGLIARQYILSQVKRESSQSIQGAIFFATPHTGAGLAGIGKALSFAHRHLSQLCIGSDLLDVINQDWVLLKIDEKIPTLYVVGSTDKIVSPISAAPYIGANNVKTLVEFGHENIIEPSNSEDIRYMLIKQFVRDVGGTKKVLAHERIDCELQSEPSCQCRCDVLFDRYNNNCEKYYIQREHDKILQEISKTTNVWISGPSGCGKTASLCRLIDVSGWEMHHIMLDAYLELDAVGLMREICKLVCEKAQIDCDEITKQTAFPVLLSYFRRSLEKIAKEKPFAFLIEEIPLSPGCEYTQLLTYFYQLSELAETNGLSGKYVWLFTSINCPAPDINKNNKKFRERIELIEAEFWDVDDIRKLILLISEKSGVMLESEDQNFLISHSRNSPRFIKAFFRDKRLDVNSRRSIGEIVQSVEQRI